MTSCVDSTHDVRRGEELRCGPDHAASTQLFWFCVTSGRMEWVFQERLSRKKRTVTFSLFNSSSCNEAEEHFCQASWLVHGEGPVSPRRHVQHRSHDLTVHCIVVNETCWASALIRKKSKTASSERTTFSGGCLKLRYFRTICNANSALMRTTRFRGNAWSNMTNPNFCHRRTAWKHGSN